MNEYNNKYIIQSNACKFLIAILMEKQLSVVFVESIN